MAGPSTLRSPNRYITTLDESGRSVLSSTIPAPDLPLFEIPGGGPRISLVYATNRFPVKLDPIEDLATYNAFCSELPPMCLPQGVIIRIVDIPPSYTSDMHRSVSMGYNTVVEGEVELILDSGESRRLLPGDTVVHRMDNHAWRNNSTTQWARLLAVVTPIEGGVADGHKLPDSSVPFKQ
ncbi:uncharacterized protein Z520_02854 [Fonsecaea multimorphosa CBS 102226]|uniref:Cupin 2 conserved barrel domain-containing protein n=1 Tax=Fonsecaea multimorphosa CBS 102226 TaxID=1442371 RepID=A0A0D2IW77_9EURO|nr:uncharacterized protein Z520_02854 [Fonsecaea multimorphosa CBS 102226]KIY01302.1 hypothetical protein Z520_02854 [Fonsecaea multimorphosa CBS 102226]OAL28579.1 hypothetical protein AYO22_02773 [Fonsecaea multimorphosa]